MAISLKDPKSIKLLVGAVIIFTITIIWYFTSYTKNAEIIAEKSERLEQLRSELLEAKRQAADYETIRARTDSIFTYYKSMESLMPTDRNVPDFLKRIAGTAKNTGIFLKNVNVLPTTKENFYEINPYSVYVAATFNSLGEFLESLANWEHLINFTGFQIMQKPTRLYSIETSFRIQSYSLPPAEVLEVPSVLREKPPEFKPTKEKER